MPLEKIGEFLRLLTEALPPIPDGGHHALFRTEDGRVAVCLSGYGWICYFEETDAGKSLSTLVQECVASLPSA